MIQIKESDPSKKRPIIRVPRGEKIPLKRLRKGRIEQMAFEIIDPNEQTQTLQ